MIRVRHILLSLIFLTSTVKGQTISGNVVAEDLSPLIAIQILANDSTLLGMTDTSGFFKISVPSQTVTLLFQGVGLEPTKVKLTSRCSKINLVMMYFINYDFMTLDEIDELRLARFRKLDKIHRKAVKKGVFSKTERCYERVFEYHSQ